MMLWINFIFYLWISIAKRRKEKEQQEWLIEVCHVEIFEMGVILKQPRMHSEKLKRRMKKCEIPGSAVSCCDPAKSNISLVYWTHSVRNKGSQCLSNPTSFKLWTYWFACTGCKESMRIYPPGEYQWTLALILQVSGTVLEWWNPVLPEGLTSVDVLIIVVESTV